MIEGGPGSPTFAVFLRAANVGGHQVFKPTEVARRLKHLDIRSVGAAGTFAVGSVHGPRVIQAAFREALPFEPEAAVVEGKAVEGLIRSRPFGGAAPGAGERWFVSVLLKRPSAEVALPLDRPERGGWQIRVTGLEFPFALSVRRPKQPGRFYPNEVVERAFGIPATTRSWSTLEALGRALTALRKD